MVAGGRLITQVRGLDQGDPREFCIALDAATGAELWSRPLDIASYDNLVGYDDAIDGPRSSPSVVGNRVFVLTSQLKLFCLRADNGGILWQRDFVAEFGSPVIAWQSAASPLVVGDLVFVNCNAPGRRLLAVRVSDGTTAWQNHEGSMTHASPAFGTLHDTPHVIFVTQSGLIGVVPESGELQWRLNFQPSGTSTAATPVVSGGFVYASAAYGAGAWAARISENGGQWSATQAWRQRGTAFQNHWSTPVAHEGFLYSVVESGGRSLACLDVATGINRWITSSVGSGRLGFGNIIKAGGHLLVLTEPGELVLIEPDPSGYRELARQQILTRTCWNIPTVAGGRLFARSSSQLVALDVSPGTGTLPPLSLAARLGPDDGKVTVVISGQNGVDLDSSLIGRVELRSAMSPAEPLDLWTLITAPLSAVDGTWEAVLPADGTPQFIRAQEKTVFP